jgi:hypothetical protein
MSNYDYEDDDLESTDSGNDLVKQLRKAAKQKDKELSELKEQFNNLTKSQRERAIKDALAAKGVNTKIASFIPSDIDPTEESVSKWLESNADVFGIQTEQTEQPNIDPAQAAAYKKMSAATESGMTPDRGADVYQKLMSANTREELDEIIRQSGL